MRNLLKCFHRHYTTGPLFAGYDWDIYFTTIMDPIPSLVSNPEGWVNVRRWIDAILYIALCDVGM